VRIKLKVVSEKEREKISPLSIRQVQGKKVLIIDTNENSRKVTINYLKDAKLKIIYETTTAKKALNWLLNHEKLPDIILSERMMPDMKGDTFANKIKMNVKLKSIKLVVITAETFPGATRRIKEEGFDAFLPKPILRSELIRVIQLTLSKKRPSEQIITKHMVEEFFHKKIRILVAEDHPVNQKLMKKMLNHFGYHPDIVSDGKEALDMLKKEDYDLCLMDLQMPKKNGYEVTRDIRKREGKEKHTMIIALTAAALDDTRKKCFAVGMDDFLTKPIRAKDLKDIIRKIESSQN